ncbi:MAG: hypothetical protein AVO33_11190 [delta proteobacterium ML8_F1]|nr:MAG: hypothetical protein AVO33_11190 [delta proteobacterium ML8_F1]
MLGNILVLLIIALILSGAVLKLRRDHKQGSPCAGCPYAKACAGGCSQVAPVNVVLKTPD